MSMRKSVAAAPSGRPVVPPLENGDRLTRREFHERYLQHPEIKKAELVEGVVHMPSPVSTNHHADQHGQLATWLGVYAVRHENVRMSLDATLILGETDEPQPDVVLRRSEGGRTKRRDGYLVGGPELVAEVSASTVSYDMHFKKEMYRRHGVQEYIVWRVWDGELDWFRLRDGQYDSLRPDAAGIIASEVFPGLRLNVAALLAGDMAAVLEGLE